MICMSIRLVYDTRNLQKYDKMRGNWAKRGQNHILCYFFRNMELRWPILHQSWVQIGFVDLENNLDDLHIKKTCLLHQEAAKIHHNERKSSFKGSKSCFMLFFQLPGVKINSYWHANYPNCFLNQHNQFVLKIGAVWAT